MRSFDKQKKKTLNKNEATSQSSFINETENTELKTERNAIIIELFFY